MDEKVSLWRCTIKAISHAVYGSPEVVEIKDLDRPVPAADEVLVKVCAASLNASDWELLTGKPLYARIRGLLRPKYRILGSDIAGRVESVGSGVTKFEPGDAVFGDIMECMGGLAEYVCAPARILTRIPEGLTFEQAAAVPQAACIALQGIRDKGQLRPGQTVLINGAGGGSGTFAIQIAKSIGAEVTGVDNARKLDLMRSLGADHVMDYKQQDFTRSGRRYDLILDHAAYHSVFDYRRALRPNGRYLMVGGSVALMLQLLLVGSLIALFGSRKLGILAVTPNKDLDFVGELVAGGKLAPVIDRCYPLCAAAEALAYLGEGRALGKVIITIDVS